MKALFISHQPLFPVIGGDNVRMAQSLRLLAEICEVDVAYLSKTDDVPSFKEFVPEIKGEFRFSASPLRRYSRILRTAFNREAEVVNHFRSGSLLRWVKRNASRYDLIFCASTVMGQYAFGPEFRKKLIDMTDCLTMNYGRTAENSSGLRRILFSEEARRMESYEKRCIGEFDALAYIAAADRDFIGGGNKFIVGNAVREVPEKDRNHSGPESHRIVFVGKMDYSPNILAVTFFAREVMPGILREVPDAEFLIVGTKPTAQVQELGKLPGVTVTGRVPEVGPYFAEASVVVAPMLSGSGVQNKILEALAHGARVVTTPTGAEGIESLGDVMTVVQPEPSKWVGKIVGMLKNPDQMREEARKAPERLSEEFGISKVRKEFRRFVGSVVDLSGSENLKQPNEEISK